MNGTTHTATHTHAVHAARDARARTIDDVYSYTTHKDIRVLTYLVGALGTILVTVVAWVGTTFDARLQQVEHTLSDRVAMIAEIRNDIKWIKSHELASRSMPILDAIRGGDDEPQSGFEPDVD